MEASLPRDRLVGQDDREYSDQCIYQLLRDAEQRLGSALKCPLGTDTVQKQVLTLDPKNSLSSGLNNSTQSSYIKITNQGAQVGTMVATTAKERKIANKVRTVDDPVLAKPALSKAKANTAGASWYDLPRTVLTTELKRDLQLLQLRSVLDPKRHFKKETAKSQVPEFSQVGTIIEGPTEFFSARLTKKERKQTFAEEVLSAEITTHRFKSKYNQIQSAKMSGKRAYYQKLKAKRTQRRSRGGSP